MIDNFGIIKHLLEFDNENEFYFLQILQRKKDHKESGNYLGTNNNNRLIKAYYIYSIEQLEKYKNEIAALCNLFDARAMINLNRRNDRTIALEQLSTLALNIKIGHYAHGSKLYNTICGQYSQEIDKKWILDLDRDAKYNDNGWDAYIEEIMILVQEISPKRPVIARIPSKNGIHLITHAFNSKEFSEMNLGIEIHKNNPTNLYIP